MPVALAAGPAAADTVAAGLPGAVRSDTLGVVPAGRSGPGAADTLGWRAGFSEGKGAAAGDSLEASPSTRGQHGSLGLRPARRRPPPARRAPAVWWVTVRSGIYPGWGQLVNGKPVKAALLAGLYTTLAVQALAAESDRKAAKEALGGGSDPALVARVNRAVDRRNSRFWLMGATMLYAMLDAYVDAHFFGYDDDWRAGLAGDRDQRPRVFLSYRF